MNLTPDELRAVEEHRRQVRREEEAAKRRAAEQRRVETEPWCDRCKCPRLGISKYGDTGGLAFYTDIHPMAHHADEDDTSTYTSYKYCGVCLAKVQAAVEALLKAGIP